MKTNPDFIAISETISDQEIGPIVFVPFNLESSQIDLNMEYSRYQSNNGQMDIFSFIELRIRTMRMDGEFQRASDYGLMYLSFYEQELLKAYNCIVSDDTMSPDEKKSAINWVISRITIREMTGLILMGEHQIILCERFSYWKEQFHRLLSSFGEKEREKNRQDVIENVHQEVQDIFRILDEN